MMAQRMSVIAIAVETLDKKDISIRNRDDPAERHTDAASPGKLHGGHLGPTGRPVVENLREFGDPETALIVD